MSETTPGDPIPSELLDGVPPMTPRRLWLMRGVLAPLFVLCSIACLALAGSARGPIVYGYAWAVWLALCLGAFVMGRAWIHRAQRLTLERLRRGQRPTGTDRAPRSARGSARMLVIALMVLLMGYPVSVVTDGVLPWPFVPSAVLCAFSAGGAAARVPTWIRERKWPSLEAK